MNLIIIKALSALAGGVIGIVALKAEDQFYNRQFDKSAYIKIFIQGWLAGFITLTVFEMASNYFVNPVSATVANLTGGGDGILLGGLTTNKLKFNNGTPNF